MYLHIGGEVVVRTEDILAVCDLDNTSSSYLTRQFLSRAEKEGRVVNAADDLPKSFVAVEEKGRCILYLSQLSPATLLRRAETVTYE